MSYKLIKKLDNGVRVGELTTPHGVIKTPFFMPVGTVGSVKSAAPWELKELNAEIILCNTYHLYLRPGEKLIKDLGGLHKFVGWDGPILTDSGGYQVFSLARGNKHNKSFAQDPASQATVRDDNMNSLVKITEDGVEFKSHLDGSKHFFTPEKVIDIQLDLGVDILMPLDVCPSGKANREEVEESVRLTTLWAKRSKLYFESRIKNLESSKKPLLHGIVQGGLYPDLREKSASELIALDMDGYSVGGLAVDLETREMWDIVKQMGETLPENKQRYLMGVGTPDDIIQATKLGMDMFDCVLPTRLARHGNVYVKTQNSKLKNYELINLLNSKYRTDPEVIDKNCNCPACRTPLNIKDCEVPIERSEHRNQSGKGFSRAYISHLLRCNEILGIRLTTLHNLYQYLELMRELRRG